MVANLAFFGAKFEKLTLLKNFLNNAIGLGKMPYFCTSVILKKSFYVVKTPIGHFFSLKKGHLFVFEGLATLGLVFLLQTRIRGVRMGFQCWLGCGSSTAQVA